MTQPNTLQLEKILGADSWRLVSRHVEAAITQTGGMIGPVTFKLGSRRIAPYSVAPWAEEPANPANPPILQTLRGDFFCAPFGGNATEYNGQRFPVHGETANRPWELLSFDPSARQVSATFQLRTVITSGTLTKQIRLVDSHTCVYSRHTLSGFTGPMPLGHHAMLRFPDEPMSGLISTSPFIYGQVFPTAFENPALQGYQALKPAAMFKSLQQVPMIDGTMADLGHYPARPGFEDLVMVVATPKSRLGWNAVCFAREGYVWFALRDTHMLRNTVFWISNGGRHYAPWNGRHTHVLGIEDVTAYFHCGIAESAGSNPIASEGLPTAVTLDPNHPTVINYITGIAAIPNGFDRVASLKPSADRKSIILTSTVGHEVQASVDLEWLGF